MKPGRPCPSALLCFALCAVIFCALARTAEAGPVFPEGVDKNTRLSGLYPGEDAGSCCWMARRARITVAAPRDADAMIVTVFIPTYALRETEKQAIIVRIDSHASQTVCCLGPGLSELAFSLPSHHAEFVTVSLAMSRTFVPARVGQGHDLRELSVLLRGIEWRNTLSGNLASTIDPRLAAVFLGMYAVAFLCAVILTRLRPVFGAVFLIASSPFALYIPIDGTTLTLQKTVLVGVAFGLVLHGANHKLVRDRRLATLLLMQLLFALVVLLSLSHAAFHAPVWREFLKQIQYALTALVAFAAFRADKFETRENCVRVGLLLTTFIVIITALLQERGSAPMGVFIAGHSLFRIAGPLEGPNQLGAFLGITLPLILAFALTRTSRLIDYTVFALGCLATVLTFSRGGVTGLAIGVVLVLSSVSAYRFKKWTYRAVGVLFAVLFLIALGQFAGIGSQGLARVAFGGRSSTQDFNGGLGTRAQLWHGAYILWRSSPVTGVGAGNYELRVAQTGAPGVRTHANSAYFQTLAEDGTIGFVALVLLAIVSLRVCVYGGASVLPRAMLAVGVALWFHQITDYLTFYPKVGILMWTMLGIGVAAAERSSAYDCKDIYAK